MKMRMTALLVGGLLALMPYEGSAEEVVAEFKGSTSRTTPEFEVDAPWLLDWRIASSNASLLAVDVSLERGALGVHEGTVLRTKQTGNGVRLFEDGGTFQFRVNSSMADWTLKVIQLSEEEAAQYTPKQPGEVREGIRLRENEPGGQGQV